MKKIELLFKKELKRYFDSPLAYIIIIVFLIISGWLFSSTVFLINQMTIEGFIANVPLLLMFFAPAIAMQLLAGEFNTGTIEILGSLPLKDREIIAGKYIAAFTLLSTAVISTFIFPLSISFLGDMDWGQVIGSYISMIMVGGVFLSFGVFSSAVSSNQVIAFIIGFAISFTFFIMGKVTAIIPPYARPIIGYLGIDAHWESLSRGVIDIRDIVYFFSIGGFFLYCGFIAFTRRVRIGLYSLSSVGLLAGILIMLNILTMGMVLRLDLTENKIYSLTAPSKRIVKSLKDPVIIKAYFSRDLPGEYLSNRKYLNDILHEYRAYSGSKVRFKFIDPSDNESFARDAFSCGIMQLRFTETGKEKLEIKQGYMGIALFHGDKKEVIPVIEDVRGLEYDLTTRIKKVTSSGPKQIGYVGELNISEKVESNISARYDFRKIEAPEDVDGANFHTVVIKADESFGQERLDIINKLADKKIPMAIYADLYKVDMNTFRATENDNKINDFLVKYNISLRKSLILDPLCQRINIATQSGNITFQNIVDYPYFPKIIDFDKDNPVVKDLKAVAFSFISPIDIKKEKSEDYSTKILAQSSERSWLDASKFVYPFNEHSPGADAEFGPFPVICIVKEKKSPFRMIITANSRFINENLLVTPSNANFFLNTIDWLAADPDLIAIRSKGVSS
ncbi:Gldg family protein, partial [Elusimicrobiota bacterium]